VLLKRRDDDIGCLFGEGFIIGQSAEVGRGGICPLQSVKQQQMAAIFDDPVGVTVRHDKRRTSGTPEPLFVRRGHTGEAFEGLQGVDRFDVVFVRRSLLDLCQLPGILRDKSHSRIGSGQKDFVVQHRVPLVVLMRHIIA